ncbi:MAG: Gfo/Idh/MocA family oxidoreductase [Candidatus Kapabacteria bacterium]|jgi:predicted dehydrogenase|nr:Gfo/Idh/MocA family oxidoreductase [Candidatus Kapabacteria bacterium]
MTPPCIAVIGTGHLGAIHARLWLQQDASELVALYDADIERSQALASTLAQEFPNAKSVCVAQSLAEALTEADAVTIATPTSTHFAIAEVCLQAGKHCFIEKPITTNVEEGERLAEIAQKLGLIIHVGHVERFNPALTAIDTQRLQPLFIEAHRLAQFKPRATDVSVILDLMIHDIDIALWLVKSPVVEVHANGVAVLTDTPDIANARLRFENGCVANLTASRISAKSMRKMRIFQRDAYLSLDFAANSVEMFHITDDEQVPTTGMEQRPDIVPAMMLGNIDAGEHKRSIWYEQPTIAKGNAISEEQRIFAMAVQAGAMHTFRATSAGEALEALRIAEVITAQMLHP